MGALVGCWGCGFVTTRHSGVGTAGKCPHCGRPLEPIPFSAALRIRKGALAAERAAAPRTETETNGARVAP